MTSVNEVLNEHLKILFRCWKDETNLNKFQALIEQLDRSQDIEASAVEASATEAAP
jgi:hypothetical protein